MTSSTPFLPFQVVFNSRGWHKTAGIFFGTEREPGG